MENVDLLKISITPSRFDKFEFIDDGVLIKFEKDQITLKDYHEPDCCESVYADWEILKHYEKQLDSWNGYSSLTIKGVPEMGLLLTFDQNDPLTKVLVPCYNDQNGYYSSDLELIVKRGDDPEIKIDVTSFIEDHIC